MSSEGLVTRIQYLVSKTGLKNNNAMLIAENDSYRVSLSNTWLILCNVTGVLDNDRIWKGSLNYGSTTYEEAYIIGFSDGNLFNETYNYVLSKIEDYSGRTIEDMTEGCFSYIDY